MRDDVRFESGGGQCAAWWYPAEHASAAERSVTVVMGTGFSMTRHDGLPAFAQCFAAAGLNALVFDYRHFGDSSGKPRQLFRKRRQLQDWRSAVAFARSQPGADPDRIVLWGYSFGAGYALATAARDERVAALVLQAPFIDGLARVLATPPRTIAWILPRALADAVGLHNRIPVTGEPSSHAAMTLPGEADGFARAIPPGSSWRNEITPGVFATVALHRPVRLARRIACPMWVGVGDKDISVSARAAERLAARAPAAELHRYDADHFDPVSAMPDVLAADHLAFLSRGELRAGGSEPSSNTGKRRELRARDRKCRVASGISIRKGSVHRATQRLVD